MNLRERLWGATAVESRTMWLASILLLLAASIFHARALPLVMTWDGHEYIALAEVIASDQFDPSTWKLLRTPLYPLALKASFLVIGKGAFAARFVAVAGGVLGCILISIVVRQIAGGAAASLYLLLQAFDPVLASFENMVLSETGTLFFIALVLTLVVSWSVRTRAAMWTKTVCVAVTLAVGFYWRPSILLLAPWFALLVSLQTRRAAPSVRPKAASIALHALLVIALPYVLTKPWTRQFPPKAYANLNRLVLRSFAIRQFLMPEDEPYLASVRSEYATAIRYVQKEGVLSGLRWSDVQTISRALGPISGSREWQHLTMIRKYPARYANGVGRSLLLFAGFAAAEDEVKAYTNIALSPHLEDSAIGAGPVAIEGANRRDFAEPAPAGLWRRLLLRSTAVYYWLRIAASFAGIAVTVMALKWRNWNLLALSGTPIVFALAHAVMLMSLNRFMVPVYPMALGAMTAGIACVLRTPRDSARPSSSDPAA